MRPQESQIKRAIAPGPRQVARGGKIWFSGKGMDHPAPEQSTTLFRRLVSEFWGTFALTFFDAAAKLAGATTADVSPFAQALTPGLIVAAMIYSLGASSGAHINPAVTFAFALRGVFPWSRAAAYVIVQAAGALVAALFLKGFFGNIEHLGATLPLASIGVSFPLEILLTFTLVSVILGTATQHRVVGPNAAIAVGATITACSIVGKPLSGASMNPARSLGPALVSGETTSLWIYIAGPLIGAALAVLGTFIVQGLGKKAGEEEAAQGDH